MSVVLRGVGLCGPDNVVKGEVLFVDLVLLEAFSSLWFIESLLFSRLVLCLMVTSSHMVGWLVGLGCCGMWVSGVYGYRRGSLFIC